MAVEVEVQRACATAGVPGDGDFQRWAEAALAGRPGQRSLAIRIVDEAEAKRYNRQYRGRDRATNVLSFRPELPPGLPEDIRQAQLGDLLICAPLVAAEAAQSGWDANDHWAHLTVHGILHLLGFDHQRAREAAAMESLEVGILAQLGISDPYQGRLTRSGK